MEGRLLSVVADPFFQEPSLDSPREQSISGEGSGEEKSPWRFSLSRQNNPDGRIRLSSLPGFWLLPWIVPAAISLYLKYILLAHSGYSVTAESLGRTEGLGFWEKLSFFRMDVIAVALTTIALFLAGRLLPRRLRLLLVSALSAAVTLAVYAQLRAFLTIGQFLSLRMFWTAILWGWHEPAAYVSYLGGDKAVVVLGTAVIIVGSVYLLKRLLRRLHSFHGTQIRAATLDVILYCLIPGLVFLSLPRLPSNPYNSSVLLKALSAYWHEQKVLPTGQFANLDTPGLLSEYRKINHAPEPEKNMLYWGKAKGSNVVFFVLETMPARFLPLAGNMDDLPNLRLLRERSFVGLSHYTTFPRTHEAVFSLLSSLYPVDPSGAFEGQKGEHAGLRVPGVMAALSARGYYTATYSQIRGGAAPDEEMFRELGVQHQIYPPDSFLPPPGSLREEWKRDRIGRDLATLDLMKQDIEQCFSNGRRFAAVFLPQISHFPYPDVPQEGQEQDLPKRARGILEVEDGWLGQLMDLLRQQHQLDNTIIVIVGDHGVRSHEEDPVGFIPGMIDEYSFHVPLLIYAPKALDRPVMIPWLTSHIDVTPTLLDLLGVQHGREFEEGSPIWDARLADRTTYFLANWMFGADGYYSDGRFYMQSLMSGAVYAGPYLHFQNSDIIPMSSANYSRLSAPFARMAALQKVATARFASANPRSVHIFVTAPRFTSVRAESK